jgi:hypothetical protein
MARTIKTLTLLGLALVLAMPGASAQAKQNGLDPSATLNTIVDGAQATVDGAAGLGRSIDPTLDVAPVVEQASRVLECREVVHVHSTWYGAKLTASRDLSDDWLERETVTETKTESFPIYKTVTTTLASLPGPLAGLSPPVTRTATVLDHVEVRTATIDHPVDARISASWTERYYDWSTYHDDYYVDLVSGIAAVDAGYGKAVTLCDSAVPVQANLLSPHRDGVDAYCTFCSEQPKDGWQYWRGISWVRSATADDLAGYREYGCWRITAAPLVKAIRDQLAALPLSMNDVLAQNDARRDAGLAPAETAAPSTDMPPIGTEVGSTLTVPPTTGFILAGLALAVLGLAGFGGRIAWKKLR